ncbi:XRE family transcriptional regulator [Membranihabitans marinus]|uniref:XRE family transcriptional regulator n=1 Tax=Membranihabitans marinus TaxID=1227546 RepID=UPI0021D46826|nr:helix-turn-helix domain-containing protein [Membranihabitans marinus]
MIAQNIKYLRKQKKWTQQDLADKLDLPRTTLGDYERGKTEPSIPMLVLLAQAFDVDIDALIRQPLYEIKTEVGRTIDKKGRGDEKGKQTEESEGKIATEGYTLNRGYQSNGYISYGTVELVESKAEAGYLESMSDPEFVKDLPKIHIPNLPKNYYRGFEINGDSMLPLESGTLIISTLVSNLSEVKQDKTYIIITKREGLVYKRLAINPGKNYFTAYSDNSLYPPYQINFEDIAEIWQYYAHIGFSDQRGLTYDNSIEDKWSKMESMVEEIHKNVVKVKD